MKKAIANGILSVLCSTMIAFAGPEQEKPAASPTFSEKEISFKAEDGWTILGTLSVPAAMAPGESWPGVVLVHSPAHDQVVYLGRHLVGQNRTASLNLRSALERTITLRIDIRGRGKSLGAQEYHTFTAEQRSRVALDIGGAIAFLRGQPGVDGSRIGLVAEGESAEFAVVAAYRDPRVGAVMMLSGRMGREAKELLASREDLPVLCVVSREDKIGLMDMTGAYASSRNVNSDLLVYRDLGIGNSMFITWANKFPDAKPLEATVSEWLLQRLQTVADLREVSFQTEDGWTLYGTLRTPRTGTAQGNPGVILVHSYLSDRYVFSQLERMLVASDFAVLNFDFRGRGKSQAKGGYFDLPDAEREKAYLDARAAMNYLASQKGVNPDRLAVVATSIGVKYGLKAVSGDPRVKSFVMLGGFPDRADVMKARFPILFVSSLGVPQLQQATREFYLLTKQWGSQLLEYEGSALGYQTFEIDEGLQSFIIRWLKPQLSLP